MKIPKPDIGLKFAFGAYSVLLAYSYKQELKDFSEYKKKCTLNEERHLKMLDMIVKNHTQSFRRW